MRKLKSDYVLLAGLTLAALFIHGYHIGVEDQAIYLPAVRKNLNPSLYPHDSELFLPLTNETAFGEVIAFTVRHTHLSCSAVLFIYDLLSIYLILLACLKLTRRLFNEPYAQWAGTCLITSLLTLPVAGTALYLVDEYLHPRTFATVAVLFAVLLAFPGETPGAPVDRTQISPLRLLWMFLLLAAAALVHIQMAFYGALLLLFLLMKMPRADVPAAAAILPLRTLWEPASAAWRKAARTRTECYMLLWHWYEWLGAVAPLAILEWFARIACRHNLPRVAYLCRRLTLFGLLGLAAGLVMTIPARFERLTPYQPMRTYHVLYLLFFLIAGGFIGKWLLQKSVWRWLVLFIPLSFGMFYAQLQLYPGNPHIEWPGVKNPNPWMQAFYWIRHNTPKDAYFALNPDFMKLPDEDFRGFRAIAERSRMADNVKDPAVVTMVPTAGDIWLKQVKALQHWNKFTVKDFKRLKQEFGVNWVILQQPGVQGLNCPYQNSEVRVCRIE